MKVAVIAAICALASSLSAADYSLTIKNGVLTGYTGTLPEEFDLVIPDSVKTIGAEAFGYCDQLTSVVIPSTVKTVGKEAFQHCWNLVSVEIKGGGTEFGKEAFQDCSKLTSVTLPEGMKTIWNSMFEGCSEASVTIPASVTTIDGWALSGVKGIAVASGSASFKVVNGLLLSKDGTRIVQCPGSASGDLEIPSSVKTIGAGAFAGCPSLSTITIPASVTGIESWAFYDYPATGEIRCAAENAKFCVRDGALLTKDGKKLISAAKRISGAYAVPNGVTKIDCAAFCGQDGMTSVSFPNGLVVINEESFEECTGLTSVTLPASVTQIGEDAFKECLSLEIVTINASQVSIDEGAFDDSDNLKEVRVPVGFTGNRSFWIPDGCKIVYMESEGPTVAATAANVVATYDGTAHGIAVSVSEPASGVTVEYALSADGPWQSEAFSFTEVCAATQVWYRALAEGYLGVTNKATVTVNARPIQDVTVTLSLPDGGYKYDGTAKEPAVSVTDSFSGFSSSDYSVSYSDNVNAGTAKVVVTGVGSHYSGTKETTFSIAPRTLTFTSASAEWAWDGAAHSCETAPTVTGDGFVGEDGATFSGFVSVTAPGTYENTFSYAFTSGTVAANYDVSQVYGKLRIFNYKASVKDDGTVKIDGLGDEPLGSTEIAIPEKIDGKPVTEIAEGAFANSTCGATSLTLAKYCKKIGASAFRGIGTLKTVTFVKVYETDDVTEAKLEIGANAFNSTGVASLSVPDYVKEIGNYAFANCGDLKRVAIPAGTTVSTKAFYRSGITAGAKPEVITFSAFTVSGSVATMKVTGTGGSIDVSGLAVYFSSSLGARAEWAKIDHSVGETVLTNTGCEVTVTVNVPTGAAGAYFYVELAN